MKNLSLLFIVFLCIQFTSFAQEITGVVQTDTAYSSDNVPIVYQKTGNGEQSLVFVHGWSCDKNYWSGQLEYFGNYYSVYTLDLAGHGESSLGRDDWTIENYGKDVKAVVEKENRWWSAIL